MSRVGKKPIAIPSGVEIVVKDNEVIVKGPKGEIKEAVSADFSFEIKDGFLNVSPKRDIKRLWPQWGLFRALLQNSVTGVCEGFEKKLEIRGVGYKAAINGAELVLEMGFSHPVKLAVPQGVSVVVAKDMITVSGIDKYQVGQLAANIRKVRPPEPYKGKGIRYLGEKVRKKEGKKAGAA
ncbi:MAG: 50S ribosomal protein L6 [Patescibacteria group bacterium]|nr:50S ribosomal protein L6 [Patescibacteria group bacterium]